MADYSIESLAAAGGATVRNVRAYRDRGLLPVPERRGRHAVYHEEHLSRLGLITKLLDRGYSLSNIAELLNAWQQGHDISDVLGLTERFTAWSEEVPTHVTLADLVATFGTQLTPTTIDQAQSLGVLEPAGDGYLVRSPKLATAGVELVAAGVPLTAVLAQWAVLRQQMDTVASGFVSLIAAHLVDPLGDVPTAEQIADLAVVVERLRPVAQVVVEAEMATAMERSISEQLGERIERIVGMLEENHAVAAVAAVAADAPEAPRSTGKRRPKRRPHP